MRAVALLSGGLDSSVACLIAAERISIEIAVTVDYGQRSARREIEAAAALCGRIDADHRVIELPWLAPLTSTALVNTEAPVPTVEADDIDRPDGALSRARAVWVPNRNGLLANVAACFADAENLDAIVVGLNAEEALSFSDNTPAFADALTACFSYSTQQRPHVLSPTIEMTKRVIAAHAVERGLTSFWSCYHGGETMCGRCESCARTIRAFGAIGRRDHIDHLFANAVR